MTRETKVGLLVGMGVILLIGIIVSDHLSMAQKQTPPDMTGYAPLTQSSLAADGSGVQAIAAPPAQAVLPPPDAPLPPPRQAPAYAAPLAPPTDTRQVAAPVLSAEPSPAVGRDDAMAMRQPATSPGVIHLGSTQAAVPAFQEAALASRTAVTPRPTQGPQPMIHYVQRGETLYAIAQRYYNEGDLWPVISHHNRDAVRPDNSVLIGARLEIPNKALLPELLRQLPQAAAVLTPDSLPAQATDTRRGQQATRIASAVRTIKVERGDTLSGLAAKHLGSAGKWDDLLQANRDQMTQAADLRAGMTLKLPADLVAPPPAVPAPASAARQPSSGQAVSYTVKESDTLFKIAQAHYGDGNRWKALYEANRQAIKNPNHLPAGLVIRIPAQGGR